MRWLRAMVVVCGIGLASAGPAWAALPANPGPPKAPGKAIVYGSYVAIGVMLAAVCTAVFKPAKRTHQD